MCLSGQVNVCVVGPDVRGTRKKPEIVPRNQTTSMPKVHQYANPRDGAKAQFTIGDSLTRTVDDGPVPGNDILVPAGDPH